MGDYILLRPGEFSPCDLLLLASSDSTGDVYVSTASLDGEKAPKHKQILASVQTAFLNAQTIGYVEGEVVCDLPAKDIFQFSGKVRVGE